MSEGKENAGLARSIGLFALVVYGVGDMVGAGIYGTIGEAAGFMGNAVWLAFVVSMVAALLTGLTYASLSSRYPRAAGAAYVTQRAYGWKFLSYMVGLAVTASGLTSMATGSRVFAQNFQPLLGGTFPLWIIFLTFIGVLTLVNLRGIRECMWVNIVCTAIEVGGLLLIIAVSVPYFGKVDYLETPPASGGLTMPLVMSGAVLAFYAFVGFEDLLNLAEEVKNPRQTMPWGIILAVACATIIYVLVSLAAISVVPYALLADAKNGAPMAQITKAAAPWIPHHIYTGITLFAVANTALINFIMGSRLVYGMARQGLLPKALGAVHPTRHTPHRAILVLAVIVAALAFSGNIRELASATSLLLLMVFGLMNVALIVLKLRKDEEKGAFEVPIFVPLLGSLVCATLIYSRLAHSAAGLKAPLIAAAMLGGITVLYFLMRPKNVVTE
jgi:APA family basic amino acid/polyamine antiporter